MLCRTSYTLEESPSLAETTSWSSFWLWQPPGLLQEHFTAGPGWGACGCRHCHPVTREHTQHTMHAGTDTHTHKLTHHISGCMDDPALLLVFLPICCLLLTCCRTESLQNSAGCRAGRLQSWLHILCILVFLLPSSCASLWAWHDHHALNNAGVLLCFF